MKVQQCIAASILEECQVKYEIHQLREMTNNLIK